jgi:hypothetical protein
MHSIEVNTQQGDDDSVTSLPKKDSRPNTTKRDKKKSFEAPKLKFEKIDRSKKT